MTQVARFRALLEILDNRPYAGEDPLLSRLVSARSELPASSADFVVLARQALWREHLREQLQPEARVQRAEPWPRPAVWEKFGFRVEGAGPDEWRVHAGSIELPWLDAPLGEVADIEAAIAEWPRRPDRQIRADPAVTARAQYDTYSSPGQQEAVRSAFFAPEGSTVIVNIPTGAGKALAFQFPALQHASGGGFVLVVVPTTALAIDQEERFLGLLDASALPRPMVRLAYHGGLDPEEKRRVRAAIREAQCPILFTSPEAAFDPLSSALGDAARSGRLRVLAIDEAHLVNQWGDGFRPHFQALAGLRKALLKECADGGHPGFRTLLLSATITPQTHQLLCSLFGDPLCQSVSEVHLRPEPSFLLKAAATLEERKARVLDALRFLPRPLILYTTKRDDADEWREWLESELGLTRVRTVKGGDMSGPNGEEILAEWRQRSVDVIVATSAFGLGMDSPEVRSVVHACIPETIDRYYQEVGRGGRDGRASVSLLVSIESDLNTADGLAHQVRIGPERGFARWKAMFNERSLGRLPDVHLVPLDAIPTGYTASSRRNQAWNLRTLGLMARAGWIEFASDAAGRLEREDGESQEAYDQRVAQSFEQRLGHVPVRILRNDHEEMVAWNERIPRLRRELAQADERAFESVYQLRVPTQSLEKTFREVYAIPEAGVELPHQPLRCPVSRRGADVPNLRRESPFGEPSLQRLRQAVPPLGAALSKIFAESREGHRLWVSYPAPSGGRLVHQDWVTRMETVVRRFAAQGVAEFDLPVELSDTRLWELLSAEAPTGFVCRAPALSEDVAPFQEAPEFNRATLLVASPPREVVLRAARAERPAHLILFPEDLPDPERPDRLLASVRHALGIRLLLSRLEA
jgi:ATP-dependent DNA helicase RecQ